MPNTAKTVVITPGNTRVTALLEELDKKKAALKKKVENIPSVKQFLASSSKNAR